MINTFSIKNTFLIIRHRKCKKKIEIHKNKTNLLLSTFACYDIKVSTKSEGQYSGSRSTERVKC